MRRRLLLESENGPAVHLTLLSAVTADETTSEAIPVPNADKVAMICVYEGTVSGGEVVLESALTKDYEGDWANEGSSTGASDSTDRVVADGPMDWVRARVNEAITGGGTVTVYLMAVGEY
jgi:hypothetical protein